MRLFWTSRTSVAQFRSRTPSGDSAIRPTNFLVSRPKEVSYRVRSPGDFGAVGEDTDKWHMRREHFVMTAWPTDEAVQILSCLEIIWVLLLVDQLMQSNSSNTYQISHSSCCQPWTTMKTNNYMNVSVAFTPVWMWLILLSMFDISFTDCKSFETTNILVSGALEFLGH